MSTFEKRIEHLENIVEKHLIESGEIRTDLRWLKKAFWSLFGLGIVFAGAVVTVGLERLWR